MACKCAAGVVRSRCVAAKRLPSEPCAGRSSRVRRWGTTREERCTHAGSTQGLRGRGRGGARGARHARRGRRGARAGAVERPADLAGPRPDVRGDMVRRSGGRAGHRAPAGAAARAHPVRRDPMHPRQDPGRGERGGAPAALHVLGHRPHRGRARPLRSRGERLGDGGAAPRLQALPAAAGDRARRSAPGAEAPPPMGRRREDAGLHRGQHPRERGRGRRRDDAGDPRPRDDAARCEPDRGRDPEPLGPRDHPRA